MPRENPSIEAKAKHRENKISGVVLTEIAGEVGEALTDQQEGRDFSELTEKEIQQLEKYCLEPDLIKKYVEAPTWNLHLWPRDFNKDTLLTAVYSNFLEGVYPGEDHRILRIALAKYITAIVEERHIPEIIAAAKKEKSMKGLPYGELKQVELSKNGKSANFFITLEFENGNLPIMPIKLDRFAVEEWLGKYKTLTERDT